MLLFPLVTLKNIKVLSLSLFLYIPYYKTEICVLLLMK